MVTKDEVEKVVFQNSNNKIVITPKKKDGDLYTVTYYTGIVKDDTLVELLEKHKVEFSSKVVETSNGMVEFFMYNIFPFLLIFGISWLLFRPLFKGGGMMGVGKSNAKIYVEKETGVTFLDVAGQEEAKESLRELVDFLHNPGKYAQIGAKLPKGALLVGPPGTGKTLLAKALAGEAKVPFFSLSGSDFVELYVGVGASRVRDLFKQAQQKAPCIIFIDEVDAIGKSRDGHYGGNDEREQTLNQLLSEMDGFDTSKGLVVLAATNRPEVLDKALLRPGRFDRRVIVDKPDLKGRVDILRVHAKDVMMDDSVDLDAIALATSGAVGSDLANMINEAAIMAVKDGRRFVRQSDLFEAVEIVIAGKEKKDRILGPEEKKIVAYHEVGHALVTALQKNSEPVQKITIVPRTMGALGYVMQVPEEEKYLMSQEEMINRITTCLGGRAAEKIIFNSITTGASNDIEQATKLARAMVTQYGMSDKFGMIGLESIENKYLDGRTVLNCSDSTAAEVDHEVMRILKECYDVAEQQLQENIEVLHKIAEFLIQKETVTGKEFMRIYRQIKGIEEPEEEEKPEQRYSVQSRNVPLKDNGNQNPQPQSHPGFSNAPFMPNFPHPDVRNGQGMPAENEKGQQRVTSEPVSNQQVLSQKAENGQRQMEAENRED
jgi:cell division protease FtsH